MYQIKGNGAGIEHHASTYYVPTQTLFPRTGWGQKVDTFFSEGSLVVYQINGNRALSSIQAHILPFHTPSTDLWGGAKRSKLFLLNMVMKHIKLKLNEQRVPCKHQLRPYTHPRALGLGQNVAYQIKEKEV